MSSNYINDQSRDALNASLPKISQDLDSIRAYQWEIQFELPTSTETESLLLGAKQVTTVGFTTEDIEVHRLNDKVFYPGKSSPEEVTVTFDNIYNKDVANKLWNWYKSIYDPTTGKYLAGGVADGTNFKSNKVAIILFGPAGEIKQEIQLYGVYPKSWKTAEFNYSTNEFHTIELGLRYDFMDHILK